MFYFQLTDKFSALVKSKAHGIGLITQVESALGLLNLHDVCKHAFLQERPFSFEALIFGSDDFLASIGKD